MTASADIILVENVFANAQCTKHTGFSATISDSFLIGSLVQLPVGVSTDAAGDLYLDSAFPNGMFKLAGFSVTVSDSFTPTDSASAGCTWDGSNLLWFGSTNDKLYKATGFSVSVSDSVSISGIDTTPRDLGWTGTDVVMCGQDTNKVYLTTGFSATVADSFAAGESLTHAAAWDGSDALFSGSTTSRVKRGTGFGGTVSDSYSISPAFPLGLTTNSFAERLGISVLFDPVLFARGMTVRHPARSSRNAGALEAVGFTRRDGAAGGDALTILVGAVEVKHLIPVGSLPGVAIRLAAGRNGPGRGRLESSGTNARDLTWKAPGSSTAGEPVTASADGIYLLRDGDDADKWLRVEVYTAHLRATGQQGNVYLQDRFENLVALDDVTAAEASAGSTEVYTMTLRNDSDLKILALTAWLNVAADLHLSDDGVAYVQPDSETHVDALAWSSLDPGSEAVLYMKRIIGASEPAAASVLNDIRLAWDGR